MTKQRKKLGSEAERIAAMYLKIQGLEILERNYTNKIGEIDLIAKDGDIFVIVEVKAKTGSGWGSPEEMVGYFKQKKIIKTAEGYFMLKGIENPNWRIDVVAVEFDYSGKYGVDWIKNAVEEF